MAMHKVLHFYVFAKIVRIERWFRCETSLCNKIYTVADLNQFWRIFKSNLIYSPLDEVQARGLVLSFSLPQRLLCVAGR